jgi:hypothetical protein
LLNAELDLSDRESKPLGIQSWRTKGRAPSIEPISGCVRGVRVTVERSSVDHGYSSLVAFLALDAHAGSGGGRGLSRSIRRKISANRARGTATSASWNTT